ncbi:phosphatidylserine decarboxylase [Sorochytrium milnesiophthora]
MSSLRLIVQVVAGRDLAAKDRNGLSDPFAVVEFGTQKCKTRVVHKSLNPRWEQEFELYGGRTVWDWDQFSHNDFLGVVLINIDSLFDAEGRPIIFNPDPAAHATWHVLGKRSVKSSVSGEIMLNYGLVGTQEDLQQLAEAVHFMNSQHAMSHSPSRTVLNNFGTVARHNASTVSGMLFVEVVSASNLPYLSNTVHSSFDMDPFMVVTYGLQSYRTRTIKHSLEPEWNEKMALSVTGGSVNYPITFTLYDHERVTNNDLIGHATLSVEDLMERSVKCQDNLDRLREPFTLKLQISTDYATVLRHPACLYVRAWYLPLDEVRKHFWATMLQMFETTGDNKISEIELRSLLLALGAAEIDELIEHGLRNINKLPPNGDPDLVLLTMDEAVQLLESLAASSDGASIQLATFQRCPICHTKEFHDATEADVLMHVCVCNEVDPGHATRFMMSGFLTEAYTKRNILARVLDRFAFGKYVAGDNNANILVLDRLTGQLVEEKIPTYIRLGIRMMYRKGQTQTSPAQFHRIKVMLRNLTMKQGRKFNDPASVKEIAPFVKYHKLNMDEVLLPPNGFANFNEFFYRKLIPGARVVDCPTDPGVAVSPADCRCMAFQTVDDATKFWIKGRNFSVAGLLDDPGMAEYYKGGSLFIFRLAPQDYHRFHIPVDGVIGKTKNINGTYFTVNPIAIRTSVDVYLENVRAVTYIDSDCFGRVAYVSIGAMMVGSINLTTQEGQRVARLDEQGYFAFGGSTIVVLFPPGALQVDHDLLDNSSKQTETLVRVGMHIGRAPPPRPPM